MNQFPLSRQALAPCCPSAISPASLIASIECSFMGDVSFTKPISSLSSLSPSVHIVNVDARVTQGHEQLSLELSTKAVLPSRQASALKSDSLLARESILLVLASGKTLARARYVARQLTDITSESREC